MKKLFTLCLLLAGFNVFSQDMTGTWEGEFIRGNIGLQQPSKMVLEIVQVDGKLYGIFDLYPIDTRKNDQPNITFTVEGAFKPEAVRYSLIRGRIVEGKGGSGFFQFIFEHKSSDTADLLAGRWFRELEPLNSQERGAGTFIVKRVSSRVSDRLKPQKQQKDILQKLEKQDGK